MVTLLMPLGLPFRTVIFIFMPPLVGWVLFVFDLLDDAFEPL